LPDVNLGAVIRENRNMVGGRLLTYTLHTLTIQFARDTIRKWKMGSILKRQRRLSKTKVTGHFVRRG
jgi:hypothetical protein